MKFNRSSIIALKQRLEETGYANDEQDHLLGSTAFKHHRHDIIADLRSIGYHQQLEHSGGYFENGGPLYWFNDPALVTTAEAEALSVAWDNDASSRAAK